MEITTTDLAKAGFKKIEDPWTRGILGEFYVGSYQN
jgi:hypothetical protein